MLLNVQMTNSKLIALIDQLAGFHFTAKKYSDALHTKNKISSGHRAILKEVYSTHSITVPLMAQRRGLSPQAIQRPVDELVKRGYIKKSTHPVDKRTRTLCLTPLGIELISEIANREFAEIHHLDQLLDNSEIEIISKAVAKISTKMDDRLVEILNDNY